MLPVKKRNGKKEINQVNVTQVFITDYRRKFIGKFLLGISHLNEGFVKKRNHFVLN